MKAIKASTDQADRLFGVSVITNSTEDTEAPNNYRELVFCTLFLGKTWVHINVFVKQRSPLEEYQARSWEVSYEPGYGWLNSFGEKRSY